MNYNAEAQQKLEELQEVIKEVQEIGDRIKANTNMFDTAFYLSCQDQLSQCYDVLLSSYMRIHAQLGEAEASSFVAIRESHKGDVKKPIKEELEAESRLQRNEIETADSVLEAWEKIIKNYIQTCRNHVMASVKQFGEKPEE